MSILKEKAGVISKDPCWVAIVGPYLYISPTFTGLLKTMFVEWKLDKHLVG